jgi:hypothetical protein
MEQGDWTFERDLKMDFTRKARWVLDGHKTPNPVGFRYAGALSRDSVQIAFTYAALNEVNVCAADIKNAYLQAPVYCKDYIICGPNFGLENVGKVATNVDELGCGLCSLFSGFCLVGVLVIVDVSEDVHDGPGQDVGFCFHFGFCRGEGLRSDGSVTRCQRVLS